MNVVVSFIKFRFFIRRATVLGFSSISRHLSRLPPLGPLTRDSSKNENSRHDGTRRNVIARASGIIDSYSTVIIIFITIT